MDTAKLINLFTTFKTEDLYEFVNAPLVNFKNKKREKETQYQDH
jgi:hypothetical protein